MEIVSTITLSISGALLMYAGGSRVASPIKNYLKNSGITLSNEVNTINEARGVGALMAFGGITALLGVFLHTLTLNSHIAAALIFLGFAIGRLISMKLDGPPNKLLVTGLISELILGAMNIFCLVMSLN